MVTVTIMCLQTRKEDCVIFDEVDNAAAFIKRIQSKNGDLYKTYSLVSIEY